MTMEGNRRLKALAWNFYANCNSAYNNFGNYPQFKIMKLASKSNFSVDYLHFVECVSSSIRILNSNGGLKDTDALVGYRGNIVKLELASLFDRDPKSNKVTCHLCSYGIIKPTYWINHVNSGDCIVINPSYYIKEFDGLPLMNNRVAKIRLSNFPDPISFEIVKPE